MEAIRDENGVIVGMVGKSGYDSSNTFKKQAQENIKHLMNGGQCSWGKYERKVFQGENGNFYIEDERSENGCKSFSGLFGKLKIID